MGNGATMNPILTLTHNGLELTKKAVDSFLRQDIQVSIYVIDNASADGTLQWLETIGILLEGSDTNAGVSAGWNQGLNMLFDKYNAEHVLVTNNDVELPRWFYRDLLSCRVPFVTGVSSDKLLVSMPPQSNLVPHPDFSAFLIRRSAWKEVGPFDEDMKFYAQDCDYHVRACKVGVPLLAANAPFYHERSSTLRRASPEERVEIEARAGQDRENFRLKHGFTVGSPEYQEATKVKAGTPIPFPGEER